MIILLVLVLFIAAAGYIAAFQPRFYHANPTARVLFTFLETLPKDSVLGGRMPDKRNSVPMYARRTIVSRSSDPSIDINAAAARAYFAPVDQIEITLEYCQACNVDYLVVDITSFTQCALAASRARMADSYLSELYLSFDDARGFALEYLPAEIKLFQVGDFTVVACDETLLTAKLSMTNAK